MLGDPVTEGDGSLVWAGTEKSDKRLAIPAAYAYPSDADGRVDPARAVPDVKHATLTSVRAGDGWDLTVGVDEAWYAAQDGPVTLDPSIHYWYAYGRPGYTTWGSGASYSGSLAKTDGAACSPQTCPAVINNTYWVAAGTNAAPYNDQYRTVIGWNYDMGFATGRYDYAPSPGMNVPLRAQINDAGTNLNLAAMNNLGCMGGSASTFPGTPCNASSSYTLHNLKAPAGNGMTWANVQYGPAAVEAPATVPTDYHNDAYFKGSYNRFRVQPLIQQWVNDPDHAYGLMIKSKDGQENTTPKGAWWYSSNAVDQYGYQKAWQPFLTVDFNETAPDWSNKTAVPTPAASGSTVSVKGSEANMGTWGIWYASALVNADNGTVARYSPARSIGSGPLEWTFNDVPPGRYYVVENGWNHATDSSGAPARGWTKSKVFDVAGSAGQVNGSGREGWWSFEDKTIGPKAVAGVNVGNGNLVVQHSDTPAVQGHGRLGLGVERTYNSNAPDTIGLSNVGRGWNFVTSGVGDGVVDGVGLSLDPLGVLNQPVTVVDRDGTRHVFVRNETSLQVAIGDQTPVGVTLGPDPLASLLGPADQVGGLIKGLVDSVNGTIRKPDGTVNDLFHDGVRVCVESSYKSPTGVNLSLWRFVGVALGTSCPNTNATGAPQPIVLGYATVSPDRVRSLYSLSGRLSSVIDPAGNELRYEYGIVSNVLGLNGLLNVLQTPLSQLRRVYDPRGCNPLELPALVDLVLPILPVPGCRQVTFNYPVLLPGFGSTVVTDSAGRTVTYTTDLLSQTLSNVDTRSADGGLLEHWGYTYQGVSGKACGGRAAQMCSVIGPNGAETKFTYQNGRVVTLRDRTVAAETDPALLASLTTSFAYTTGGAGSVTRTDVTKDGKARRYDNIDSSLRVADIYSGAPDQISTAPLTHVRRVWDGSDPGGAGPLCQPAADPAGSHLNHNLCSVTSYVGTVSGNPFGDPAQPDQTTDFVYNPEGGVLTKTQHVAAGALVTQNRYLVSSWLPGQATATQQTDDFGAASTDRPAGALFSVNDLTGSRSPKGVVTNYDVDADPTKALGALGAVCGPVTRAGGPQTGGGNTGLGCNVWTSPDGTRSDPEVQVTTKTYDPVYGQVTTVTDPTGAVTGYDYYPDSATDISGQATTGGWLKTVTDPAGRWAAFGYDRSGNVIRAYDRNNTAAQNKAQFNPDAPTPPAGVRYTATLYGPGRRPRPPPTLGGTRGAARRCSARPLPPSSTPTATPRR